MISFPIFSMQLWKLFNAARAALNNYSMLKLFFNQNSHFYMYGKDVPHQYYATYQDTKQHILS